MVKLLTVAGFAGSGVAVVSSEVALSPPALTAQKLSGRPVVLWTKLSPLRTMKPLSPAAFSFSPRRSSGVGWKVSRSGSKANQPGCSISCYPSGSASAMR